MKNELDYFRKFSIVEYSVNIKKFKEYLEFCRKNYLYQEKIDILENLVNLTNEKSQSGAPNLPDILNNYTNLCVLVVIFSDFEIENFFKIQNFTLNFQKTVLFQAINYCLDRTTKEQHEQLYLKFGFWVLKLMNKNISVTGSTNPITSVSTEELTQSIESLSRFVLNNSPNCQKCFLLKSAYELGYYYYLIGDYDKMRVFFLICINGFNFETNEPNVNSFNSLYFNKEELELIYRYNEDDYENLTQSQISENVEMKNEDSVLDFTKETNSKENDFENFFNKISIDNQAKLIIDKFSIDDTKSMEMFNLEELIKNSKNMIFLTFKNYRKLGECKVYLDKTQDLINKQMSLIGNMSENDKKDVILARKENSYHQNLITIIESVYNNEEKLKKQFLSGLSESILKLTLTDDLQISGMIHGLIINFTQSFKSIMNYFNDFVEFFKQTKTDNQPETVSLINFISYVLKVINYILFSNFPANVNTITIEGDIHYQIFNIIFFWMYSLKENRTNKNDNILFLLIKTIKNSNFLIILKIIYLRVLQFLLEKKNISAICDDDIFDQISQINPNFFKLDTIINENKNNKKFSNFNITFKEDNSRTYIFDSLNLDFFVKTLFNLIKKIEKKIIKYGKYSEVEYLERRNNLLFFEYTSNLKQKDNSSNVNVVTIQIDNRLDSNEYNSNKIIIEYLKYYKTFFQEFKLKFYRNDLFENLDKVLVFYDEFKKSLDEVNLLRLIYILSSLNKSIEASILLQYTRKIEYDLAYKLLKRNVDIHNIDKLEYIWKIAYFELLANIYYQKNKTEHLSVVTNLLKRTSNHQFFKRHPLRKLFKILNFLKFVENLTI